MLGTRHCPPPLHPTKKNTVRNCKYRVTSCPSHPFRLPCSLNSEHPINVWMSHANLISPHTFKLAGFAAKAKPRSERSRPRDEAPAKTQPRFFFLRLLILAKPPMQESPGRNLLATQRLRLGGNMGIEFSIQPVGETDGSMLPLIRWLGLAWLLSLRVFFGINLFCEKIRRFWNYFP